MSWLDLATVWKTGGEAVDPPAPWTAYNFINGEKVAAEGGQTIDVIAPSTGRKIATIPKSGVKDVQNAVMAAESARKAFAKTTVEYRSALLNRIADLLETKLDNLAALESMDQGKTITQASRVDIPRAVHNFRFFAGAMLHGSDGFHRMAEALNYTLHTPLGTVGLITPWNLPLYLLTWKVAPALAMGNAIVAKPSELSPLTATVLSDVMAEAGVPKGIFNLVHGYGQDVGQAIVEHPLIHGISFTGGTATGAKVAATSAPLFKKVSLELGGKNPTIVFADAEFDKAVKGAALAGFANQGEICLCGSRILVERSIHDKFLAALVEEVKKHVVGDPRSATTTMGALISYEHREKVESYIQKAKDEGGKIECGGVRPDLPEPFKNGAFLLPTIVSGLSHTACAAVEEIFGPVVTVHPFDTVEEAVQMANCTKYGLAGSVWTTNLSIGHRVAAAMETGMVWVNCWLLRDLRVPFGGVKASGVGREGGRLSLDFFSESKNVCINVGPPLEV